MDLEEAAEFKKARQYALKRVAAQNYHSILLGKCLERKQFSQSVIVKILDEFQRLGFLNDTAWIESFVRLHRNKFGVPFILAKLKAKGIETHKLSIAIDHDAEKGAVLKLLGSRYRNKDLSDVKERHKVISALLRKGFTWEIVRVCLESSIE